MFVLLALTFSQLAPARRRHLPGAHDHLLTVGEASVRSVKCAYARPIKLVGPEKVVDIAHRMGITKPLGAHLSLSLEREPVTPLPMAAAHATLSTGGVRHDLYFIESVVGRDGEVLYRHAETSEQAVSSHAARICHGYPDPGGQQRDVHGRRHPGPASRARPGRPMRTPTPGSSGSRPNCPRRCGREHLGASVSMYDVGAFARVDGGTYPARIFGEYMRSVLAEQPGVPFLPPEPPTRESNALALPPVLSDVTRAELPVQE